MSVYDEFEIYIWPDPSVMTMKVNGSPTRGDLAIAYDTVSSGSYAFVEAGMTLIVKNAGQAGLDVRVRIKAITADVITVAENGIIWSNDQDLEVVKTYEIWGVAPRIITSGGVTTVYKDYDIPYTDQLQRFDPVVNMGGHYAGPIGESVYFTSSGTFDPQGDTLSTPNWLIEGSVGTAYIGATPGYVKFVVPGAYIASCEYVNSNGKRFTGRRHILIGEPIRDWGISSFEGGRDRGGYSVKIWLREYVPHLREGSLVILRSKINVPNDPRGNIVFVGYVMQKSLKFNYSSERVEFEAVSVNGVMDKLDVFGATTAFAEAYDPVFPYWFQIYRQTVDKAVIAFLRWHTTVLTVTDFYQVGNSYFVEKIDFQRGGAANPIREIYQGTIQADLLCDVQGNLRAEYIQNQRPLTDRTTVVKETLQPHMWRSDPEIIDHEMSDISYLEAGGVAYTGATGTTTAALAGFPSTVPGRFGKVENITGLVLPSVDYQTYLNEIAGFIYADRTNRFSDMKFPMSGNRRDYDITPHKWTFLSLAKDFAKFLAIRISPTNISHVYDPRQKSVLTDITFEVETSGVPAVTIPIPPPTPEDPPTPPPPPVIPPPPSPDVYDIVVIMTRGHLAYSLDAISSPSTCHWHNITPPGLANKMTNFVMSSSGGAWVVATSTPGDAYEGVWYCPDIFVPSWSRILATEDARVIAIATGISRSKDPNGGDFSTICFAGGKAWVALSTIASGSNNYVDVWSGTSALAYLVVLATHPPAPWYHAPPDAQHQFSMSCTDGIAAFLGLGANFDGSAQAVNLVDATHYGNSPTGPGRGCLAAAETYGLVGGAGIEDYATWLTPTLTATAKGEYPLIEKDGHYFWLLNSDLSLMQDAATVQAIPNTVGPTTGVFSAANALPGGYGCIQTYGEIVWAAHTAAALNSIRNLAMTLNGGVLWQSIDGDWATAIAPYDGGRSGATPVVRYVRVIR